MDHEYFKHGSCIGGLLTYNQTAYFAKALELTAQVAARLARVWPACCKA